MTSPEAVTISNCPFCGGAVKPTHRMIVNCDSYWEICCNEEGHSALVVADTEVDALAKWNARAAPRPTDADCPNAERPCTCHPYDNPPVPCAKKYAFSDCVAVSDDAKKAALDDMPEHGVDGESVQGWWLDKHYETIRALLQEGK